MASIGERLKKMREILDLDQSEFGKSLGISSRDTISRWERGLNFPPADILALIHEKYGINTEWIVTGRGPINDESAPSAENVAPPFYALTELEDQYVDFDIFGFLHSEPIELRELMDQVEKQHWIDLHFLLYKLLKKASIPELMLIQHVIKSWLEQKAGKKGE